MRSALSLAELELRIIYAVVVAGKSAVFANEVMLRLVPRTRRHDPFGYFRSVIQDSPDWMLGELLRVARTGKYRSVEAAIRWLVSSDLDLATVTPEQLEVCPGVGPKTSRFFVLWSRPWESYAVLDVHILRWLRRQGYDAPESTPSGARYRQLESVFLEEARKRDQTPRELDLEIWSEASSAPNITPQSGVFPDGA